jgi:uncharacterized integral membrane protein
MTVQPGGQQPDGRKLSGGAIASLTGLGVLLIFIIQNNDRVRFQFLFWTFTWPLWWYTIMTAVFGALVWFGLGVMRRHRRRMERRAAATNRWLLVKRIGRGWPMSAPPSSWPSPTVALSTWAATTSSWRPRASATTSV